MFVHFAKYDIFIVECKEMYYNNFTEPNSVEHNATLLRLCLRVIVY